MNFAPLEALLETFRSDLALPGAEISLRVEHKELFRRAVGFADLESGVPLRGGELYYFYSATKPITSAAVMQLLERKLLSLDDPISRYLPEFSSPTVRMPDGSCVKSCRPITVEHLLTMTSGLDYNLKTKAIFDVAERTEGKCPTREIIRAIAERPLHFHPGERWLYGLSHDVLAALVEVVSGMRYSEYVTERIFLPLGMTDSYFHATDELRSRMTTPYALGEMGNLPLPKTSLFDLGEEYESGGAALISSVPDYARFADAMANGGVGETGESILRPETIDLMRENRVGDLMETDGRWRHLRGYGYGLGVRTRITADGGSVGEFGWDGAKGVYVLIDPLRRLSLTYAEHRGAYKDLIQTRLREVAYACLDAK